MTKTVATDVFETRCLELLEEVKRTGQEIVVTRDAHPVARLVPVEPVRVAPLYGRMRGTVVHLAEDAFEED